MAPNFARQASKPAAEQNDQTGEWEASIAAGIASPGHLLAALFIPGASAAYSARGINKFPVVIGITVGLFFYATAAFIVLTAIEGEDQPATTIGGMEFKAWQTGAGWALMNFLGITFMLRGWFRDFYKIPGSKCSDFPVSFLCSCCALAQMSKHTQIVSSKSTLPGYNA